MKLSVIGNVVIRYSQILTTLTLIRFSLAFVLLPEEHTETDEGAVISVCMVKETLSRP